ncbi:hotdog fold thioesterase [Epidermidibacterium keratini]|uniref:Hotdog fold thioesterase n=1 Tax=Epidermidibacterium keratini TaxID=1891644 RepID=A0A7L4YMU2_9ACTN|nr:PaaI family thioesterase [Epidermidibacterium keratini]QHC00466.1 hotdog fold thioesterase [Epidermidibacterium keratini]
MNLPDIAGLPAELGITDLYAEPGLARASLTVAPKHLAPIGRLHAGTSVTLADTVCGYGCLASLPDGATGFATSTITSHHVSTAEVGDSLAVEARLVHGGRTTQLWEAGVHRTSDGKLVTTVRVLQQLLYPR